MTKGLGFDPGFGPHILEFQGTVEYLYTDINRFKNLSQRKIKFRQYYKKILEIFKNNLGFYIGCLMWAAYIKTEEEQDLLNNYCFGREYSETEITSDVDFMIKFTELFPKDMKYFIGETFKFEPIILKLLETYKEFLVINKGFVDSKTNTDIKLPGNLKASKAKTYKEKIDKVLEDGDLSKLNEYSDLIV